MKALSIIVAPSSCQRITHARCQHRKQNFLEERRRIVQHESLSMGDECRRAGRGVTSTTSMGMPRMSCVAPPPPWLGRVIRRSKLNSGASRSSLNTVDSACVQTTRMGLRA